MARSLDGVNQYFSGGPAYALGTNSSVQFWWYHPTGGKLYIALGRRATSSSGGWSFRGNNGPDLYATYYTVNDYYSGYTIPSVDAWYHFVMTKSGTTLNFYANGSLTASSPVTTGTYTDGNADTGIGVGAWNDGGSFSSYCTGSMAEVALWGRTLSGAEVADLYNGGSGGYGRTAEYYSTNLDHYWKLDETSGNASATVGGVTLTAQNSPGNITHPNIDYSVGGASAVPLLMQMYHGG